MNHEIYYLVLCFLLPIFLLFAYLEKRARRIMISLSCGVLACLIAYDVNTVLLRTLSISDALFSVAISPFVEEVLKFLPILCIALIVNKGRRGSTANAYAVGIGFCLVENTFYLFRELATADVIWILFRSIGTGLMHGMSATILGIGIYLARKQSKRTVLRILCTYLAAVFYHALFNFLVQGNVVLRVLGVLLPMLTYVLLLVLVKKEDINRLLDKLDGESE